MADAAAPRSPLGPAEQCANRAHDLPRGVKVNGKGYLARLWVPGRDWVNLKTWPTKEAAVAARERALERVQVEGYDWLQLHGHRAELLRDPPTLQGGKNHGTADLYGHTCKPGLIPGGLKRR